MTLKMKKLVCLGLVAAMVVSSFSACNKKSDGGDVSQELGPMTEDEITLRYMLWDDAVMATALADAFMEKYPNITVVVEGTTTGDVAQTIADQHGANQTPDAFWYVNEIDTPIFNAYWQDMTGYWEADSENKNVIHGINEYKIGYLGTDFKWATPIKFFPQVAWVNKGFFELNSMTMPDTDWTWDEFEQVIAEATGTKNGPDGQKPAFGLTAAGGSLPVTWYPLVANDNATGEFGWDGSKFNMDDWAEGLNKQRDYLAAGYLLDECAPGTHGHNYQNGQMREVYGSFDWAQDAGYVAVRADKFWTWQQYWNDPEQGMAEYGIVWVPYVQPKATVAGKNQTAVYDMGGISQWTDYPREAYELLKYMTWGVDGWKKKIELYPTLETEEMTNAQIRKSQIDVPITLDEDVWKGYRAFEWYPQAGDEYGREEYFDAFFAHVREKYFCGLGATQIPGFNTWLAEAYHGEVMIENQVLNDGGDAYDMVEDLERTGLEYYNKRHGEIEDYLKMMGKI